MPKLVGSKGKGKKPKDEELESDDVSLDDEVDSEPASEEPSDEDEKPKKKTAAKPKASAAKPAPKRKSTGGDEGPSSAKPSPKKAKKGPTEPFVDAQGFHCGDQGDGSLIYQDFGTKPSNKIAAFDLDGTLIETKSNAKFPKGPDDYKLFNKKVPKVLKDYHDQGYKVVIFSNQGGIKSAVDGKAAGTAKGRVQNLVKELKGVPVVALMAPMDDNMRKPNTGMWKFLCDKLNGGVMPDKAQSFYVGDMAGRKTDPDQSATDREFARNIGIDFKTPEEAFGEQEGKRKEVGGAANVAANEKIISLFKELADFYFNSGADKATFKGVAMKNAAASLDTFPEPITLSNLKEVGKLPKVGKGSLDKIKEILTTGTLAELAQDAAPGGGADKRQEVASVANAFM